MRLLLALVLAVSMLSAVGAAQVDWESPYGIVCPWPGLKEGGFDWVRGGAGATHLGNWKNVEKEKGVYDWTGSDGEVKGDLEQGLTPLPIIGYTPAWASSGPKQEESAPPSNMLDYAKFVRDCVSRYKGRVPCWELWNEEDIGFWKGSIGQYVDLLKTGYTAAKIADPSTKVVFGGIAGVNIPFMKVAYENGARDYYDVMAVHPYQWGPKFNDEAFVYQLSELRKLMNENGDSHKEIWLTELGWSTGEKTVTEEIQARLLTQCMVTVLTLKDMGVTRSFWFCVKDWGGPDYGLLRPDNSHKPAFTAHSVLAKTMRDVTYAGRYAAGDGVRCHVFTRGAQKTVVAVVWADDSKTITLPVTSGATAMDYMGESVPLKTVDGKCEIQARPQPVFIIGAGNGMLKAARKPSLPAFKPSAGRTTAPPAAWVSVVTPSETTRAYVVRDTASPIAIAIQNQGAKAISGKLRVEIAGAKKIEPVAYTVEANSTETIPIKVTVPKSVKAEFVKCTMRGDGFAPATAMIRLSDDRLIEFPANSTIENHYMVKNEGTGGAPSIRFNGTWTYKFDLSKSTAPKIELKIGASDAHEWRVLASSDEKSWKTILSDKSNREWRSAGLKEFAGKPLYLKIEGKDQQLEGLMLHY